MYGFNDFTAVELIPEYSIIEVCRIFKHNISKFLPGHDTIFFDIPFLWETFSWHTVEVRDYHITLTGGNCADKQSGCFRTDPVIAVEKLNVFSRCVIECEISCIGNPTVFQMEHFYPGVFCCIVVTYSAGIIPASVINQEKFKMSVGLVYDAVQAAGEIFLCIVYRNDNSYKWFHGFSS